MKICSADVPGADVVEVSIFGPGKGECVVLHLGNDRWAIVDSCVDQTTSNKVPVALSYLESLGVDPGRVVLIVATHADDDHFAGIAQVFNACPNALFVMSDALVNDEFYALVKADNASNKRSGRYREYSQIYEIAQARKSYHTPRPLRRANESTLLFPLANQDGGGVRITALSPSGEAKYRALKRLAEVTVKEGDKRGSVRALNPNEAAVALWVEAGEQRILLGADVLRGPRECGWEAILASHQPNSLATVFKVPHHGAESSYHKDVWERLVATEPVALLAPFQLGNISLPSAEDIVRIVSHTKRAYITATGSPTPSRAVTREKARLGGVAQNVREYSGKVGHIRARALLGGGEWQVETFKPAGLLTT